MPTTTNTEVVKIKVPAGWGGTAVSESIILLLCLNQESAEWRESDVGTGSHCQVGAWTCACKGVGKGRCLHPDTSIHFIPLLSSLCAYGRRFPLPYFCLFDLLLLVMIIATRNIKDRSFLCPLVLSPLFIYLLMVSQSVSPHQSKVTQRFTGDGVWMCPQMSCVRKLVPSAQLPLTATVLRHGGTSGADEVERD